MIQSPEWLDSVEYPFKPHSFEVEGVQMNYVDEGEGPVVLMVHGTPTWSFLYRNVIKELMGNFRCIVPDLPGFGLSGKNPYLKYDPQAQAQRLTALIKHLNLKDICLIVHDFGGPIGLSYAIHHPLNVKQIILSNTWMWSLKRNLLFRLAHPLIASRLGKYLFVNKNIEPKLVMKKAFGNTQNFTPFLQAHYEGPFPNLQDRMALWAYAKALLGSSQWYEELWTNRSRISEIPTLILWGMKDRIIGKKAYLRKWESAFFTKQTIRLENSGHFVQEEAADQYQESIISFLKSRDEQLTPEI